MNYKYFKDLKNGRVVTAIVYKTEVIEVISLATHSDNRPLHIFLYQMASKSFFDVDISRYF